ncbi:flippase-like domain-containing protein [Chitinophaga filiformis]|uniref:lysylphosphatidylglycerol synthase transmembrane domain-containing protein n=1 Tax=Chitinophaga filiformis TaxID=104663 RepID=UPI001F267B50|nr:lysylphosphatidylglycerol synthase transmembrane domain-containing protein [Chitinophaga filiformis]MCF6407505.1 flippase-like domain-containing protein [Chitinophaga filiformis]
MSAENNNAKSLPGRGKMRTAYWWWSFAIFMLLLILIVYYFPEIRKELKLLETVHSYWLSLAIFLQIMTYFFNAMVYFFLLKAFKQENLPGVGALIKASVISLFFDQVVPSAGISGKAYIFGFLARFNIAATKVITLIVVELLTFYVTLELLIVSLLVTSLFHSKITYVFEGVLLAGILVYLVIGSATVFAGRKKFLAVIYRRLAKVKLVRKRLERFSRSMQQRQLGEDEVRLSAFLKGNKMNLFYAFLAQLLVIAVDALTLLALFQGVGVPVSMFSVLLCFICTKIVSTLPVSPGALVLYESGMTFFFTSLGLPLASSVVVTLLYRLLSFWLPMPVGFLLYRSWLKAA